MPVSRALRRFAGSVRPYPYRVASAALRGVSNYVMRNPARAMSQARSAGRYVRRRLSERRASQSSPRTAYGNTQRVNADSGRAISYGRKRKSAPIIKRAKRVKVSKPLSNKIKKVIETSDKTANGTFYKICTPGIMQNNSDNTIEAMAWPENLTGSGLQPSAQYCGQVFNDNIYLDAASKLFNGKTGTQVPDYTDSGNLSPPNAYFHVTWAKAKFHLKNNSARVLKVKMYVCKLKQHMDNNDAVANPLAFWNNCINTYNSTSGSSASPTSVTGFSSTISGGFTNSSRYDISYMCDPRMYDSWNKFWDTSVTSFALGPGQVQQKTVYGKTGFVNLKDHLLPEPLNGIDWPSAEKGGIYTFFTVENDCVQVGAAETPGEGRAYHDVTLYETVNEIQRALIIECEKTIKIKIPERALMANATDTERTFAKRNRIYFEQWYNTSVSAQQLDIDPQEPITSAGL